MFFTTRCQFCHLGQPQSIGTGGLLPGKTVLEEALAWGLEQGVDLPLPCVRILIWCVEGAACRGAPPWAPRAGTGACPYIGNRLLRRRRSRGVGEAAGVGKSRKSRSPGRQESPAELARRIVREIRELSVALAREHPGALSGLPRGVLAVQVPFAIMDEEGRTPPMEPLAGRLVESMRRLLDEVYEAGFALQKGRVYCFLCRSSSCRHSAAEDSMSVFAGYTPTGKPEWKPFTTVCLEHEDGRVDQLFDPDPLVIALVQPGTDLQGEMLESFGKNSRIYRIMAQLVMGFIPLLGERVAVCCQAVMVRLPGRAPRFALNVIGLDPEMVLESTGNLALVKLLERADRRLAGECGKARLLGRDRGPGFEEVAEQVLNKLRGGVDRLYRGKRRTTRHARERRKDASRPAGSALTDLGRKGGPELYLDEHEGTVVALGPKGRVHVFSPGGKHVTSFKMTGDAIEQRIGRKRWKPMEPEAAREFRKMVLMGLNSE